ncbi:MAG TPA: MEDS domain-containing protein [Polyangiaceae bacterium]|nr:MEDS domain-containing protein [Polyangiaceae bacterium]
MHLGGSVVGEKGHICAFFSSVDDEYRTLLPFIKDGLDEGEAAFHTIDPARANDHVSRHLAAGIDVDSYRRKGQLELRSWNEVHLLGGKFEPEATSAVFASARLGAIERGFSRTRFVSHMGWSAKRLDDVELLEYEAQANYECREGLLSVCIYDLALFRADLIIDVMRTHPLVLVTGTLYENPYYVSPDELLRELRDRPLGRRFTLAS